MSTSGRLTAGIALALVTLMFLWTVVEYRHFSPVNLVEEAAGTYTSARNYLAYGFLSSGLLQDFSNSSNRADHPYVYDHFPPGPDILTAVLLKVSRGSFRFVRLAYAGIFLLGIIVYLKFVSLILMPAGLRGSGYAVLFLGPWMLLQNLDRHVSSPQPLLMFGPLVALAAFYRTRRQGYLYLCMGIGLISSVYLAYHVLIAALFCWLLLYLTRLVRIDRRHLLAFCGIAATGVCLHLLQNFLYLGPQTFLEELGMLLGNRILGSPSQEALNEFYRSAGLVNHGAHPLHVTAVLSQLWVNFTLPFRGQMVIALTIALALVWATARVSSGETERMALTLPRGEATWFPGFFGRLIVWIGVTVAMPIVLFPAFAQEVNLYGDRTNLYFLAVGGVVGLEYVWRQIVQNRPPVNLHMTAGIAVWITLVFGLGLSVDKVLRGNAGQLRQTVSVLASHRYAGLAELQRFAGHVYMTNINTPTVGFFIREAGFGVCGPTALPPAGGVDPSRCKIADVRRYALLLKRIPEYFVLFLTPDLFPGFGDCLPTGTLVGEVRGGDACLALMERRLSHSFSRVLKSDLFEVYALRASSEGFTR